MYRTLAYSEPETYLESETYSELCQTSKLKSYAKKVNGNNYFRNVSFSRCPLYKININFFNTCLICTPEVYILYKKVWQPRGGGGGFWYTHYNSEFVYRQKFIKTRLLHFTYVFPIMKDYLFLYIGTFITA